jgi:hypothetical protein
MARRRAGGDAAGTGSAPVTGVALPCLRGAAVPPWLRRTPWRSLGHGRAGPRTADPTGTATEVELAVERLALTTLGALLAVVLAVVLHRFPSPARSRAADPDRRWVVRQPAPGGARRTGVATRAPFPRPRAPSRRRRARAVRAPQPWRSSSTSRSSRPRARPPPASSPTSCRPSRSPSGSWCSTSPPAGACRPGGCSSSSGLPSCVQPGPGVAFLGDPPRRWDRAGPGSDARASRVAPFHVEHGSARMSTSQACGR